MPRRSHALLVALFAFSVPVVTVLAAENLPALRPPSVPLVAHDPYFSVWSPADKLTEAWSSHWTGTTQAICGLARIDGKPFRFAGIAPNSVPAMNQKSLEVWPTRTVYTFETNGVELAVTFLSPLLPDDLDVLGRSVTYISFEARSLDGKQHDVSIYTDFSGEWVVNTADQEVAWSRCRVGGLDALRMGTTAQPILAKRGDDLRIDWGYLYVAVPSDVAHDQVISNHDRARANFVETGALPDSDDMRMPRPARDAWPVMASVLSLEKVGDQRVSRHLLLGYDDLYSIELLQRRLKPYWRKGGADMSDQLRVAEKDYATLVKRCRAFDEELVADLTKAGGEAYARICTLAYRQCLAAHKLAADFDGTPAMFSKENFSNGCIGTVDVIYPACPFFLLFNPGLLEAQLEPVLDYAASARWKWPFAPHDLGTYPLANGQVYGGGERTEENQMPVEETGNMLIMLAAIAKVQGNADFSRPYAPMLSQWAQFLREKGLDPENQLCTDDFMGHLAHNANLSIKAILALGAYGQLCGMLDRHQEAKDYQDLAREMAGKWMSMAADGDHTRLAFDKPGTWSQKYNLIWDDLLGLNLFPPELARSEVAFYLKHTNKYGLPLDSRDDCTKSDWLVWSATLAEQPADFAALINPLARFINDTPDRVPFTDWYSTASGKKRGFQARSVIGGVYAKMLASPDVWKKWSRRSQAKIDQTKIGQHLSGIRFSSEGDFEVRK